MCRPSNYLALVSLVLALPGGAALGNIVVESWTLDVGVIDFSPHGLHDSAFFETVQNPLEDSHTAMVGQSYATTIYNIGWTGDSAHFDVTASHHVEQLNGETISEGRITIVPAVDSFVNFWGTWDYAWPSSVIGSTDLTLAVFDNFNGDVIVDAADGGGNVGLGPPFGQLSAANSGMLMAGTEYLLYYLVHINHYNPTPPGTFGEGSGEIHFNITPVPEPAPLALLAVAFLFRRRRSPSNAH